MPLTEKIRRQAARLGFDLLGITSPDPPAHVDVYQAWLDAGRHAGMAYLAAERAIHRRSNPKEILPSCRSILVTGTNYAPQQEPSASQPSEFQVAAYASGDDYHDVLMIRMRALVEFMLAEVGQAFEYRIYTDTGPILERELAQRAGLGWIGKNTCLIHPRHGSYLLLGEILVDLDLPADPAFLPDQCGTCTRCIDACPTGCILPDRTLDASRCISYLTIEEKASIREDQRESIGDWLFGCDICQHVCPWNLRFASPTADASFRPRAIFNPPQLGHFLRLQPGSWRAELKGSPLERPRRRGLVRNASVVAGNTTRSDLVDDLAQLLSGDEDPVLREHAAWALGKTGGLESIRALEAARTGELNRDVQASIARALTRARLSA